nr:PREDICTED: uncharacterized protein LOC105678374 [Linepithema humile]
MCSLNAVRMFSASVSLNLNKCTYYLFIYFQYLLKMNQGVLVTLEDINTGLVYTTRLSPKDAHRVETDTVFASEVLSVLKKSQGESSSSSSMISTASTLDAEIPESEPDSVFKWSHQAVLLLIEEYRKREEDVISGKISQKRVWKSISEVLCRHGHDVTGPQCQSKFNGMKRTFKSIKDHNSKSGNNPRSWPYTEVMESLLGEKPFMNPVALASSSNRAHIENESSDVSSVDSDTSVGSSNSRKRKTSQIAEVIMKSRRMAEENKLKRHQQTMDQRTEILNALNKLIDKLQKGLIVKDYIYIRKIAIRCGARLIWLFSSMFAMCSRSQCNKSRSWSLQL